MSARSVVRALAAALLAAGCNAILGIDDDPVIRTPAASCLLNSDCDANAVCVFERCNKPCAADRDCRALERCLQTSRGAACVGEEATGCGADHPCPKGSSCVAGACRNPCTEGTACLDDQHCDARGACVGNDTTRDPGLSEGGLTHPSGGSGGSAGTVGSGGSGQGGSGGRGRPDASASGGTSVDAGPDSAPDAGPECPTENALRCEGQAQAARSKCTNGKWVSTASCPSGQLCDGTTGDCVAVPMVCRGRSPGETFCDGNTRTTCGPDLVSIDTDVCTTAQYCTLSTTSKCAVCLPGSYSCDGMDLETCNSAHTGFELKEHCSTDAPCSESAHACTAATCLPNQKRCNGDRLEICNATQTGWDLSKQCAAGLCDAVALECDVCQSGKTTCQNTSSQLVCNQDGQGTQMVTCPKATPYCVGQGQCVECAMDVNCTAPDDCHTAACNAGTGSCNYPAKGSGQQCSGGYCNAAARCVQCLDATQCGNPPDSCHDVTCTGAGSCSFPQKGSGATCTGGRCTAAGACVQCLTATDCNTPPGECYTPTCPSGGGTCTYPKKGVNVGCSLGVCTSAGTCVQCNMASQCPVGTTCDPASCTNNKCGFTPAGSRTMCTGGLCDGSGSCVPCLVTADCNDPNKVCRAHACANAIESIGWPTALPTSASVAADAMYYFQLPALAHDAVLTSFGAYGNASGASAKMALYADDGTGSRPVGAPLVQTSNPMALIDGATEQSPSTNNVALTAGATYWVAFIANVATTMRSQSGTGKGWRAPGFGYGNFFANPPPNPPGITQNNVNWALYVVVKDTD